MRGIRKGCVDEVGYAYSAAVGQPQCMFSARKNFNISAVWHCFTGTYKLNKLILKLHLVWVVMMNNNPNFICKFDLSYRVSRTTSAIPAAPARLIIPR